MKTNQLFKTGILGLLLSVSLVSCDKDEDITPVTPTPPPTAPTTYNFSNVNYSGQTTRIAMMDEIGTYMSTANTAGVALDAQKLKDMYANANSQFTDAALNTSGKQLKNKTFSLDQSLFDAYFDSIASNSQSLVTGASGTAGVVTSTTNASKKYLMSANGIEYGQLIKKGLMGAVFYYQAMETYLANLATDDNTTVVTGEGTAMEHHFDEAFGYFGVAVDFPTNLTGLKYWGSYSNQVNVSMGSNAAIMNAFLGARFAISAKDYTTRDAKVAVLRQKWELLVAASAIHELNAAKTSLADDALRNHYVSEAMGFVMSLKYNSQKTISDAQITQALAYLGTNLYNISSTDINNVIDLLSSVYGLDAIKGTI